MIKKPDISKRVNHIHHTGPFTYFKSIQEASYSLIFRIEKKQYRQGTKTRRNDLRIIYVISLVPVAINILTEASSESSEEVLQQESPTQSTRTS
jgi:hypothetical protein